ncbi:hypothetical protein O181_073046 [Austropuccinia psidii MF-1]|uniref:NADH dehydrogenase [ubiquinone] 1 alpha subcomplex subunit n=1 Tax=Austropuccinia psidii MF-1 TaxID=1389203 RepID=A0A9Q3FAD1_9BASI|nr:hypothetical protein [Austropuccinia psidii MF-1]
MVRRLFQLIKQSLSIGSERFFVGRDLVGNRYYEKPSLRADSSRPKRFVNFKSYQNDPALYHPHRLPPQWSAWLAFTRMNPPTIAELEADCVRLERLKENVQRLESERKARKQAHLIHGQASIEQKTSSLLADTPASPDGFDELNRKRQTMNQSPLSAFVLEHKSSPGQNWEPQTWAPEASSRAPRGKPDQD